MKDTAKCQGCRNNFYNGNNPMGIKECWSLKGARVVRRWRIGTWTSPVLPEAFREVCTYSCHSPEGAVHYEQLPSNAVEPIRLTRKVKRVPE